MLKALSFHEPWASFVVDGEKMTETRCWKTNYRGEIYIHATQTLPSYARDLIHANKTFQEVLQRNDLLEEVDGNLRHYFTLGAIIGKAKLVSCLTSEDITAQMKEAKRFHQKAVHLRYGRVGLLEIKDWRQETIFGDLADGRFGFVLANAVRFKEPIICKGFQRLWNISEEVEAQIKEKNL